jgi:putative oxidoreductase
LPQGFFMNRMNDVALLVGRLLLAALFLPSGISKAMGFTAFSASLAAKGLPYADAWAAAAIAIQVFGPISLILGIAPRWTSLALIAFVIMATATTHRYWEFADATARRAQDINFYKNAGIWPACSSTLSAVLACGAFLVGASTVPRRWSNNRRPDRP